MHAHPLPNTLERAISETGRLAVLLLDVSVMKFMFLYETNFGNARLLQMPECSYQNGGPLSLVCSGTGEQVS